MKFSINYSSVNLTKYPGICGFHHKKNITKKYSKKDFTKKYLTGKFIFACRGLNNLSLLSATIISFIVLMTLEF